MSPTAMDFIHRFLQHVPPNGFMRPGSSVDIDHIAALIEKARRIIAEKVPISKTKAKTPAPCCLDCKGRLIFT